ncbi:MAG TPA: sigma-70 family RNA polymerase sigma factor [Actinomycetota bacterium]|jgi:RNA polymerase sigma-70 factor (ECF subfamily)
MPLGASFPRTLAEARRRRPDALAALYRDLAPAVLGYLRGQGAAEPEDLTSDTFVGMVRGLTRFRGDEAAFRSWMFTIAHRRLTDERRRRGRRVIDLVPPDRFPEVVVSDPQGEVVGAAWARSALAGLTPDQRTVVLLRVIADLPVAEVARITGRQEGAVKALHRRALASLARTISPEPVS